MSGRIDPESSVKMAMKSLSGSAASGLTSQTLHVPETAPRTTGTASGGGHVGFAPFARDYYYSMIINFFDELRAAAGE